VSASSSPAKVVIAGFGSEYRGDDGVGPLVAARAAAQTRGARDVGPFSDPLDLLGHWNGADLVIVIDAVRSGSQPGIVRVLEIDADGAVGDDEGSGLEQGVTSTHGIGLAGVLRLARALGQAPARLVVVGIEGETFGLGDGLSVAVEAAVPEAVLRVVQLIEEVRPCA
jgi:hydrogenase maturation protease